MLQMWSHKYWIQGKAHLPGAAGNSLANTAEMLSAFFAQEVNTFNFFSIRSFSLSPLSIHLVPTPYCSCDYSTPDARLCTCLCWTSQVFCQLIFPAWWSHSKHPAKWSLYPVRFAVSLRIHSIPSSKSVMKTPYYTG